MIGNDEHLLDPSFNSSFMDLRSDQKINQPQVVEEVELNRVMESKVIERNVPLQDVFNEPLSSFNSLLLHAPPKTGFPSASLWTCPSKPLRSSPQKREDESNSSVPASPTTFTPSLLPMSHLEKEKEIISNEVDEKISTMTKQEIADAQEALKERFGEGPLASLLERKRQQSQKSSTIPSSQSKTSTDPMSTTPPLSNSKTENLRPPPSHPAHLLNPFSPVHLADQLPYSLSSYFFDIQGYLTTKEKDELAQTLPEILTLTHSRALSQRLLATQLIGHLLYHLKEKEYPGSVRKTLIHAFYDLHVFIHLRTLLDDPSPPVVYAALDAFCKVLPSSLFSFSLLHQPYHQLLLHSSNDPATFTSKDTATISDHAQWIRFNFVQGLLETELMSRLTYLFINNFSTDSRSFSKKSMHKDHSNVALADQEALGGFRYRILKLMYFLCTQSELACAQILKDIPDMLPMLMISSGMDSEPLFQMEKLTYTLLLLRVALQSDVHVYRKLIQPFLLSQQTYLLKLSHHREVCNALTSLFVVITSYGYLPPLDLLSMVFQSSLAVTSTLRFSLLSSILSHELDVLCPSISSWISTARKFLETNFGICVKQIALKTKTMLALTYAFKCVPELPVSFLKAALSTLYEVLKKNILIYNIHKTPFFHKKVSTGFINEFDDSNVITEEWSMSTLLPSQDDVTVLLECIQVLVDKIPPALMDHSEFLNQIQWYFECKPCLDVFCLFARVFTVYLLNHVKSFTSPLHSLMAYYALSYLQYPLETTWERLYEHVRLLDPHWDTAPFRHLVRHDLPPRSCLFVATGSPWILGPTWVTSIFNLSERLRWLHRIHQWYPKNTYQATFLKISDLIPMYVHCDELSLQQDVQSFLFDLTHAVLARNGCQDTTENRMHWEAMIDSLVTSSYLDESLQVGLCYFMFHSRTPMSFKIYALTHLLHTVDPLLLARCKATTVSVPLDYVSPLKMTVDPSEVKKWIKLCYTLMKKGKVRSFMHWCCAVQVYFSEPDLVDFPPLEKKLACLCDRISRSLRMGLEFIEFEKEVCCGCHLEWIDESNEE